MSWATAAIKTLAEGENATIRPRGNSMTPRVKSGARVVLEPVAIPDLEVGDIVLCRVKGNTYLHLAKALQGGRAQIGNNKGRIYGRAIEVDNT